MTNLERLLAVQLTWRDAVDILVVAFIIYYILHLMRGTRAMQISFGLLLLGSTFFVARAFDLRALEVISGQILFYLPFAVIVLFQHEIRRALATMGANSFIAIFRRRSGKLPYAAIVDAAMVLAAKKIGALIVIERTQTLRMYEEGAKRVDALLTTELLVSIFTPGGPLHDGAVIVRGDRIAAAGSFLPLTPSPDPTLAHGTRHRAALGLSEESDALVVVVSEENGSMAAASEGVLHEELDRAMLTQLMVERFGAAS
ncbi:MAG TPA: diadenylate cyclase CdaA [Thermoanaerobaculia bacterium]|nr:diadenylate cyclase CdaA [Thermoanaerobaculia bacterium]